VNREAYKAAHGLDKLANLQVIDTILREKIPSCISDIVLA
jgi:hypothetical protein